MLVLYSILQAAAAKAVIATLGSTVAGPGVAVYAGLQSAAATVAAVAPTVAGVAAVGTGVAVAAAVANRNTDEEDK